MDEQVRGLKSSMDATSFQLTLRILKFLRPVRKIALIAALIIIARVVVEVLSVYFLSPVITTLATQFSAHDSQPFSDWIVGSSRSAKELRFILGWMTLTQLMLGLMTYLRSVWDTKLSMHIVYHIRGAVYDRLQRVALSFYDRMSTGQIINRAIGDVQNVRTFVNMSLCATLDIVVSILLYFTLLSLRSPWLLIAALLPIPFWWLAISKLGRKAQPLCEAQQQAADRAMSALNENLNGVHVVRAFATQAREIEKYRNFNEVLLKKFLATVKLQMRLIPTTKLIGTGAHIVLFVFAAWLIQRGQMVVGDIMLLGAAMAVILGKLQQVHAVVEAYQKAIVSSRRLFEILDLPQVTKNIETGGVSQPKLQLSAGRVEFSDVTFGYADTPVLKNISLNIPGGKITALIGPTASGKSTLAGLIARFYDPQKGCIRIDGQNLCEVEVKDLRHKVGMVFQETFLFSSSIRDNIRYGRRDVSEEMVRRAVQIAHADEFIAGLPNGYDTLLGERGVVLSGGQRQRLALARALVYDPPVLILDDATAALDASTEHAVHSKLNPLFKNRTVLIIANRLTSVSHAEYVIVLENGHVAQMGTHDELLGREGHYREIVKTQLLTESRPFIAAPSDTAQGIA